MATYEQAARRVLDRADELATYTTERGRITRPLLTPAMAGAQARVREWMRAAGLETREDALGNLAGRRGEARLMIGSHLDSVADAGRYDGILGILIGLELAEALPDAAARGRGLRRRGRAALSEHLRRQPRVRRRAASTSACATAPASRWARRSTASWARRCTTRRRAPTSRSTSSRVRCSSPRGCRSASSPRSPARAASTWPSRATPATPARPRCTCAATPPPRPPSSCSPPSAWPARSRGWWRRSASSTSRAARST